MFVYTFACRHAFQHRQPWQRNKHTPTGSHTVSCFVPVFVFRWVHGTAFLSLIRGHRRAFSNLWTGSSEGQQLASMPFPLLTEHFAARFLKAFSEIVWLRRSCTLNTKSSLSLFCTTKITPHTL